MPQTSEYHKSETGNLQRELDMYYERRKGKTIKAEAKQVLKAQGSYVSAKWAKRWDFAVAGYLAYFVAYAGSQNDPSGWIFKSKGEVYDETGLTRRQQDRARKVLQGESVIQAKTAGIGNKVHVRVNIPMLQLIDELPTYEQLEAEEAESTRLHENAEALHEDARDLHISAEDLHVSAQPIPSTSRNTHQHPSTRTREDTLTHVGKTARTLLLADDKTDDGQIERCADMLRDRVAFDNAALVDVLREMAEEYLELDPVAVCKQVAEFGASHIEKPGYIRRCFSKAEAKRQDGDESCSVSAYAKVERSKDKPKRPDAYKAHFPDASWELIDGLIEDGLGDAAIMARLEGKAA